MDVVEKDDPWYDPNFQAGYTQAHIDQCGEIIDELYRTLGNLAEKDREAHVLKVVEATVRQLNALNKSCEGNLIETDGRESLCALLDEAMRHAGLTVTDDEDVTEAWREW
jgi:hypothetical protein